MKGPTPQNRFLHRGAYRQRRLRDVARMLPVAGLILWLIPLLWQATPGPVAASTAVRYVFAVWLILIALAWLIVHRMREADGADEDGGS